MWDSPLYAVNIFYYNLLTKKMLWPTEGQNRVRQKFQTDGGGKKAESGRQHVAAEGDRHWRNLMVNHEPHSDT